MLQTGLLICGFLVGTVALLIWFRINPFFVGKSTAFFPVRLVFLWYIKIVMKILDGIMSLLLRSNRMNRIWYNFSTPISINMTYQMNLGKLRKQMRRR